MSTKPRSDSVLLNLPQAQQDQIADWLLDGVETDEGRDTGYKTIAQQIYLDLGVKTSPSALVGFYQRVCAGRRLHRASAASENFIAEAEGRGLHFAEASKLAAKQKFFELMASDSVDPRELSTFAEIVAGFERSDIKRRELELKTQDMGIKLRRLEMLEASQERARAELAKLRDPKSELTETDRAAIVAKVDSILGIA